jgi:DNA modification methylase
MKPVALVERAIRNSGETRDIVLDPFGGSGSTMIACEKAGRQARLIELDPKYCDVICRRFEAFSGNAAIFDGDGRSFEEIAAGRDAPSCLVISDQRPSWGGSSTSSASPVSR